MITPLPHDHRPIPLIAFADDLVTQCARKSEEPCLGFLARLHDGRWPRCGLRNRFMRTRQEREGREQKRGEQDTSAGMGLRHAGTPTVCDMTKTVVRGCLV